MSDVFSLHCGGAPLLVSLPHDGTALPHEIALRMTQAARLVPDTDWHVARLYAFARELGASVITPVYTRYVVDLNRPPDDVSLYPGQNTTGLCPRVAFSGAPIYLDGREPALCEIEARVARYWRPYHDALAAELERLRSLYGRAVLWDGHSILSRVPFLFEGPLPDLNLGTAGGASCSRQLEERLTAVLQRAPGYTHVVNGRFRGGYITRRYGNPALRVDAVQLELAQCNYLDEASFRYDAAKAGKLQAVIRELLAACLQQ